MIERELTKDEFIQLCVETSRKSDIKYYEQEKANAVEKTGFIDKHGKPVYFAWLVKIDSKYFCWTLWAFSITEKIEMFRLARNRTRVWAKKYGAIYSAIGEEHPDHLRWVERMGFKIKSKENKINQLRLDG